MNPARQAAVGGGLPYSVPAHSISFVCGSGLKAVANGFQSISVGTTMLLLLVDKKVWLMYDFQFF